MRVSASTRFFIETNHDWHRSIVLAGCERSGSTWVANVINASNRYRLLFEPLRHDLPQWGGINQRRYIRPGGDDPRFAAILDRILAGRIRDPHCDHLNLKIVSSHRLVKFVRANLLLKWMADRYPSLPIVFLVRHPFAVAYSRMRRGWNWYPYILEAFLEQPELIQDFLDPHMDLLKQKHSLFVQNVLIWCIEHRVPFRQLKPGDVHLLFYEHLRQQPEVELEALFRYVGDAGWRKALAVLERRSPTSTKGEKVDTADKISFCEKDGIGREDRQKAMEMLERFGLSGVYNENPEPLCTDAAKIFG